MRKAHGEGPSSRGVAVRSYAEVAAILGISRGRVEQLEKRALQKLRERMAAELRELAEFRTNAKSLDA